MKDKSKKIIPISAILLLLPQATFAAGGIVDLINAATGIVTKTLIPMAFALCLLYFFWGLAKYIRAGAGSERAAQEGRRIMVWGIVGLFVAFSIWGIVTFLKSELGLPSVDNPSVL